MWNSDAVIAEAFIPKLSRQSSYPSRSLAGADISGNWQFNVETSQGSGFPTVTLERKKGEQLTGTFHSQIFGDAKLARTAKGNVIEFSFEGDAGGQAIEVTCKVTVESATAMTGTAVYEGLDDRATRAATKK